MSGAMFAPEIRAERTSRGVESGVVQRRVPGTPRNPVVPKNSLAMGKKPVSPECRPGPMVLGSVRITSEKLNQVKTILYGPAPSMSFA